MGGTYALLLAVPTDATIEVGAIGDGTIPADGYAYAGSALGTGDYLLGSPAVSYEAAIALPDRDCECALARELGAGPISGFGASDCTYWSHLARRNSMSAMRRAVVEGFRLSSDRARTATDAVREGLSERRCVEGTRTETVTTSHRDVSRSRIVCSIS